MRKFLVLVCAAVALAAAALSPAVASAWAPAASASIHPGVMTFTDGAQCTSNFVFSDSSNVYIGQAAHCSGTGAQTDTNGCTSASLPIGTPGRRQRGEQARDPGLQLVAHDAGHGETQSGHLRVQRPRAGEARSRRRAERQPVGARVRRAPPASEAVGGPGLHGLLVRQLRAARRGHEAEPEAGNRGPERGQRVEPQRLHRHAGHPRRLGQRVHERVGPGDRRALDAPARALAGSNGVGDIGNEIAYMHANSSFSARSSCPVRSRSTRAWSGRSWALSPEPTGPRASSA